MPPFCTLTIDVDPSSDVLYQPMLMVKYLCYDAVIAA
jgi:hypothetical protein